jgi:arginine-tRNA-protein transferase
MKDNDSTIFIPPDVARGVRFHLTASQPCPYLPEKRERKVFANLGNTHPLELNDRLTRVGFRRSRFIAYRPACIGCQACLSVRIDVRNFDWSKRWKRVVKKNEHLTRHPSPKTATREQYRLLKRYLDTRHENAGMDDMTLSDYVGMVDASPVKTVVLEYRDSPRYNQDCGELKAAALTDVLRDGLSMVYSFFDPTSAKQSLGAYMVLDHIRLAQELELPYVYLGYWVKGSDKMDYKSAYKPLEACINDEWVPLELEDE